MTFRQLAEADKARLDADKAVALMQAHPSTIKRPVVEHPGGLLVGFNAAEWERALA
jgi:arsenate reductase-like glutaredoxin family protein